MPRWVPPLARREAAAPPFSPVHGAPCRDARLVLAMIVVGNVAGKESNAIVTSCSLRRAARSVALSLMGGTFLFLTLESPCFPKGRTGERNPARGPGRDCHGVEEAGVVTAQPEGART